MPRHRYKSCCFLSIITYFFYINLKDNGTLTLEYTLKRFNIVSKSYVISLYLKGIQDINHNLALHVRAAYIFAIKQ